MKALRAVLLLVAFVFASICHADSTIPASRSTWTSDQAKITMVKP